MFAKLATIHRQPRVHYSKNVQLPFGWEVVKPGMMEMETEMEMKTEMEMEMEMEIHSSLSLAVL